MTSRTWLWSPERGWTITDDNELPYHLRDDAPPLAICDRCFRKEWAPVVGTVDTMTQPNGQPCGGTFVEPCLCVCGNTASHSHDDEAPHYWVGNRGVATGGNVEPKS